VGAEADVEATGGALERVLEAGIRKGLHLSAPVADQMMMMLSAQVGRLEAGDAVTELDALNEAKIDELFERAIHARDPNPSTLVADAVKDLLGRAAAGLLAEMLDDAAAGTAVPEPLGLEVAERESAPRGVVLVHPVNDTDSHYLLGCGDAFENRSL